MKRYDAEVPRSKAFWLQSTVVGIALVGIETCNIRVLASLDGLRTC